MANHQEIYTQAMYYDIVFERDVSTELNFAFDIYQEHNRGKQANSLIDIACGPGYHAIQGAQRGLRAYGLDLRSEMAELAAQKASSCGVHVQWLAQDMPNFKPDQPGYRAPTIVDTCDVLSTDKHVI